MSKQRTTVTTCDGIDCNEHIVGKDLPEGWFHARFQIAGYEGFERATFHNPECLVTYVMINMQFGWTPELGEVDNGE